MYKKQEILTKLLIFNFFILNHSSVSAQITPDKTLGTEASRVTPNVLIKNTLGDRIDGGATRSTNLFHSFSEFNIKEGQRVYFANPDGVVNILTRVTGGNASKIFGTLGVDGTANLFLMNPNGILFGASSSLDVRGSFVGTTANAIRFNNQGIFSAQDPTAPPLLTINPSALLFNQIQANAGITNLSQAPAGINPAGQNVTGLRVPDGKSLLFVGGDINIDGGSIKAYGGNVELAGLAAPGTIGLNITNNTFSLNVPNDIQKSNVSLSNAAEVNVRGADSGSITINAQNLSLAGGSKLRAGIDTGLGTRQSKAGDININATGSTNLSDGSFIANVPQANSIGSGGNINISTGSLSLNNDSSLNTNVLGNGNGGNISIKAGDAVSLDNSNIVNGVVTGAVGNGGNLSIDAGSLTLINGSEFNSVTSGQGSAGNISIKTTDAISLNKSSIVNSVGIGAVGNGGNLSINAGSLTLTNASELNNGTFGQGSAGNISIKTTDAVSLSNSKIINGVVSGAVGNGGNLTIDAGSLALTNASELNSTAYGQGSSGNILIKATDAISLTNSDIFIGVVSGVVGNAGNLTIDAGSLTLFDNSELTSVTTQGSAGDISIKATDGVSLSNSIIGSAVGNNGVGNAGNILIKATDGVSLSNSNIASTVGNNGVGNAGNIQIYANSIDATNQTFISSEVLGKGNGGNVTINAPKRISFDNSSQILTSILEGAEGITSGDIQITTNSLSLTNGSAFNTTAVGEKGNAGNITIDARDIVNIDGEKSGIISALGSGIGKGGNIQITTGSLLISNGSQVENDTNGVGNGGNITINARFGVTVEGFGSNGGASAISSDGIVDSTGNGGDILISTGELLLKDGGGISAMNFGQGNGGNIILDVGNITTVDGFSPFYGVASTVSTSTIAGNAGNIQLKTGSLFLTNGGQLSTATFGTGGNAGKINIVARDRISIDGAVTLVNTLSGDETYRVSSILSGLIDGKGRGGDIEIATGSLSVTNGAVIYSSTSERGNAGNITINARNAVTFDGGSVSSKVGTTGIGKGGNIAVQSRSLSLSQNALISSASSGIGNAGDININSGLVKLDRSTIAATTNSNDGGNINLIAPDFLLLRRGSQISTTAGLAQAGGNGGNITINTPFIIAEPRENSDITAKAFTGNGGNVNISVQSLIGIKPEKELLPNTSAITASSQFGVQGQINVTEPEVQPTQTILELPAQVLDATTQISQLCPRGDLAFRRPLGQFTVTGRGSLPPSPLNPLPGETPLRQLATLENSTPSSQALRQVDGNIQVKSTNTIVEAQGIHKNADGTISLVAQVPSSTPTNRPNVPTCPTL